MDIILSIFFLVLATSVRADYLTDKDLDRITENAPGYYYAEEQTGVPWDILAALHYRESGLVKYPESKYGVRWYGGAFCLDRGGDGTTMFEQIVDGFTRQVRKRYGYTGGYSVRGDFRLACLCAAEELRPALVAGKGEKYAVWSYNGRASWCCERFQTGKGSERPSWRWSAFAANDPARGVRLLYRWRGQSGRWYTTRDGRPGVLAVLREIRAKMIR